MNSGPGPGQEPSPEVRGCLSLFVIVGGIFILIATLATWDVEMPVLLRLAMLLMAALAVGLGIYGVVKARHDEAERHRHG